jgi:hypothetical protein
MQHSATFLVVFAVFFQSACTAPAPQVIGEPDYGYQPPVRTPCIHGGDCKEGEMCSQNICVANPNNNTGGGTTGSDWDTQTITDTGSPRPQDTQPPTPDTKPPGPTTDDTCPKPGDYLSCGLPKSCKINPLTHALDCVEIVAAGGIGAPCTDNAQCDVDLGCHFKICTHYCEIQFAGAECNGTECMDLGHPVWGSCKGF